MRTIALVLVVLVLLAPAVVHAQSPFDNLCGVRVPGSALAPVNVRQSPGGGVFGYLYWGGGVYVYAQTTDSSGARWLQIDYGPGQTVFGGYTFLNGTGWIRASDVVIERPAQCAAIGVN
jgi:hypothetical protein